MKRFKFANAGYVMSYKELMEKLRLNDEKAIKIIADDEKKEVIIYTELGAMGVEIK